MRHVVAIGLLTLLTACVDRGGHADLDLDADLDLGQVDPDAELELEGLDVNGELGATDQSALIPEHLLLPGAGLSPPRLDVGELAPPIQGHFYRPSGGAQRRGSAALLGTKAKELDVDAWTPGDRSPVRLSEQRGRVVVIYAFQGWCPSCQSRGFPTTLKLRDELEGEPVEFVFIQTTFEGFAANDYDRALNEQKRWRIDRPVGHDAAANSEERPHTMTAFRTGGTPWTIVLDPWGRVRYNDFTRKYEMHRAHIDALLVEARNWIDRPAE